MPRHVEAWMDGVALHSVGPVMIQQVYEDPPQMEIVTGERPGRPGERLIATTRKGLRVAIEVVIRELFDLRARTRTQEKLAAWATGRYLMLSNHYGRRLKVTCTGMPTLGSARDYTSALRLEFTAHDVPYWEDAAQTTMSLSGGAQSGRLFVPGTAPAPVCIVVEPMSGALTTFAASVAGQRIALSGLSVPQGGRLLFERDRWDDLAITQGGVSLLRRRSAQSADDLIAAPGRADVSFEADTDCSVRFGVRGRWA